MLAVVTKKDPGTGIFLAKVSDNGSFHVLLGTVDDAKIAVADTIDIPNPIGKGIQRIRNTTSGTVLEAYVQASGRESIGEQWFR